MKFLKGLLLMLCTIVLAVSATVSILSYSIISSASPSLVMDLLEAAGGAEEVVSTVLETLAPQMPVSQKERDVILAAAKETLSADAVRDLTGQVISGLRKYLGSGGTESTVLVDLRQLKATFMSELKKNYPGHLDEIEAAMEEVPNKANLAGVLPVEQVRQIARPYKIATNLPIIAATVGLACVLLMCAAAGFVPGLRAAGWTLLVVSAAILAITFAGAGAVGKWLLPVMAGFNLEGLPLKVDAASLATSLSGFLFGRVRLSSGTCAALGAALAFVPSIMKRRAAPGQLSA